jgi:hypothetical protein
MKRLSTIIYIFIFSIASISSSLAQEQTQIGRLPKVTIFDALEYHSPGKGRITVTQDPKIKQLVGQYLSGEKIEQDKDENYLMFAGYRTQVFSGNNQRMSKGEATQKERQIKELFPEVTTYVSYTAPFWKLRIGDFRSKEEAFILQRQLMEAFPSFAKEMYIVKDDVKIQL